MHLDVQDLRNFYYRSTLGRAAQASIRGRLLEFWPEVEGQTLAGFGFSAPLLRPYLGEARRVMALPLPRAARWQALALVIVLSMLFGQVAVLLMAGQGPDALMVGMIQGAVLLMLVYGVHMVGRVLGGRGAFEDALILIAWLQGVMVAVQVAQIVALLILVFGLLLSLPLLLLIFAALSLVAWLLLRRSFSTGHGQVRRVRHDIND